MGRSEVVPFRLVTYDTEGRKSPHYWSGRTPTMQKLEKALKDYPEAIKAEVVNQKTSEAVLTWIRS